MTTRSGPGPGEITVSTRKGGKSSRGDVRACPAAAALRSALPPPAPCCPRPPPRAPLAAASSLARAPRRFQPAAAPPGALCVR